METPKKTTEIPIVLVHGIGFDEDLERDGIYFIYDEKLAEGIKNLRERLNGYPDGVDKQSLLSHEIFEGKLGPLMDKATREHRVIHLRPKKSMENFDWEVWIGRQEVKPVYVKPHWIGCPIESVKWWIVATKDDEIMVRFDKLDDTLDSLENKGEKIEEILPYN